MAADVLSRLILQKESNRLLKGIKVTRNCPSISYLMFADDLIIFSRALPSDIEVIQDCLNQFHDWSGHSVNTAKFAISFSTNVQQLVKTEICNQTGLKLLDPNSKYLGLPLHIKRGNQSPFNTIIDKINSRITGWKAKVLSQAAHSTLIRSVLTSIPTYWMSSFQLPKNTCAQIDARLRDFFWGFSNSNRHLYPKAWDSICKPKSSGGLSFRRAHDLNKALVSKLGWLIASNADKPWANLLRSKYLKGRSLLYASAKTNSSPLWHGIIKSVPLLKLGHCHLISSGNFVNIWNDPWIPSLQGFIPPYPPTPSDIQLVAELIISGTRLWNSHLLHVLFDQQIASSIQQIHLSASPTEDTAIWAMNPSGKFSVKLAYLIDQEARFTPSGPLSKKAWSKLWALKINERLKLFLWKIAWDSLPTREFLCHRIHDMDSVCPRCHGSQESIVHDAHTFTLLAAITCDRIWWSHNKLVFDSSPPASLIDIVADINRSFSVHSNAWKLKMQPTIFAWEPPPPGWVKFNFDVVITPSASSPSVVCRDSNGHIISVFTAKESVSSPAWVKAKATFLVVPSATNL
ncbi:hypothetical protein CMV_021349 [Castanea mollissima]|uniref:Reverse transcriptase domain-containing protein n=1 Tax=Castanea mollissima TaxID=60419 RepID=A0A8J4VF27_9ROSI|nr:hypothetical protein CMV_021349 [Castanea mollissima]